MTAGALTPLANGSAVRLADVPVRKFQDLRTLILENVAGGAHIAAFFPFPSPADGRMLLAAVLTNPPGDADVAVGLAEAGESFPSLANECRAIHLFEREIWEQWGIVPRGHPWLKPIRFQPPFAGKDDPGRKPSVMDFYRVEGEEVHEVAVGPVHAGVIEPGHFRFQCHGEEVMHLEISLGYQHRGIEAALRGGPTFATRHLLETAAGDTTCGHGVAYAMNIEALAGLEASPAAWRVRGIGLELERIANHVGDLGAMAGDVGFLPTLSYCGRLRGDILNLTALLCGNRFGRGLAVPGCVGHGLTREMTGAIDARLRTAMRDITGAVELMFKSPSVLARFEGTGAVDRQTADHLGLVGVAARASGLEMDVRCDMPFGVYRRTPVELTAQTDGDVMSRARQRWVEVLASAELIYRWLKEEMDAGASAPTELAKPDSTLPALAADSLAVSLTEGWRGQVCHVAVTDGAGKFLAYKPVDPSFHNWTGLAMALRGQQISDFPLCNKSFNLSYCGFDL